jgi:hypothetical protein
LTSSESTIATKREFSRSWHNHPIDTILPAVIWLIALFSDVIAVRENTLARGTYGKSEATDRIEFNISANKWFVRWDTRRVASTICFHTQIVDGILYVRPWHLSKWLLARQGWQIFVASTDFLGISSQMFNATLF